MDFTSAALIVGGAFAGALASGLSGFAFGLTALAIWAHAMGPELAAPMVVVCSFIAQSSTLPGIWKAIAWRRIRVFIAGGLIGVPAGSWLLTQIPADGFRGAVGAVLCLYCGIMVLAPRLATLRWPGPAGDAAVGFGGGVMGGFSGLSGVIPTLYCGLLKWPKDQQRGVFQVFHIAMHAAAFTAFATTGRLPDTLPLAAFIAMPGLLAGSAIGFAFYRRVDDAQFRTILLALLTISGITLLIG